MQYKNTLSKVYIIIEKMEKQVINNSQECNVFNKKLTRNYCY